MPYANPSTRTLLTARVLVLPYSLQGTSGCCHCPVLAQDGAGFAASARQPSDPLAGARWCVVCTCTFPGCTLHARPAPAIPSHARHQPVHSGRSAAQPAFPALSSRHATAPDHQRLTSRPHQRPCPTRTRHAPFGPRVRVARGCHPTHSFPRSLYSCPLPASPPHPPTTHPPLYSPRHTPSPRFPPPLIPFHPRRLPAPRLGGEPREGDSG